MCVITRCPPRNKGCEWKVLFIHCKFLKPTFLYSFSVWRSQFISIFLRMAEGFSDIIGLYHILRVIYTVIRNFSSVGLVYLWHDLIHFVSPLKIEEVMWADRCLQHIQCFIYKFCVLFSFYYLCEYSCMFSASFYFPKVISCFFLLNCKHSSYFKHL